MKTSHRVFRLAMAGAALGSVLLSGSAGAGSLAAVIKVKPNVGPPTIPFTVQGRGFGSNEVVDITFDTTLIATAVTNDTGSFNKRNVAVPSTATPGPHTVTATGETSGSTARAVFLVRTNWARFHFDNANTGYNPYENVISTANVGTLVLKWSVSVGGDYAPTPIVAYGRVYVASTIGIVHALDAHTGSVLWSHDTGGTIGNGLMSPAASSNLVYIGNDAGLVQALSASTGLPAWTADLGTAVVGAPVVGTGTVYVGATDTLDVLDAATGTTTWSASPLHGVIHPPTLAYGLVFTEGNSFVCDVSAFDAATGVPAWSRNFCSDEGGTDSETAAASDGRLYVASDYFRALTPQTGSVKWISFDANRFKTSPAAASGVVYAGTAEGGADGLVKSIDAATGSTLWTSSFVGPTHSSPAVANGVLYVGGADGLYAFDASTGAFLWKGLDTASTFDGSPAVSDGMIFAATDDGTVYAFGLP